MSVNPVLAAIQAQADGLKKIRVSSGYRTDLGASVIYPHLPTEQSPSPCIYRAGPIAFDDSPRPDVIRVAVTWAALVTGDPPDLDAQALDAQEDIVRALLALCPAATLSRLPILERDAGSSTSVAAITSVLTIPEITA